MPRMLVTIESDLFDIPKQDASVRENLPVRTLISEARQEFNLPEDNTYSLRIQSTGKLLDPDKTLEQQGVQTGAVLMLARERRANVREAAVGAVAARQPLTGNTRPLLREDATGKIFEIAFQPAIIGRPDPTSPQSAELLAVNLGPFDNSKSVSRYHARITESHGVYFVESLADHNPAYLNDSIIRMGDKRQIVPGDRLRCGRIVMTFGVRAPTMGTSKPIPSPN